MAKIINLFGAPGCGKSTQAAGLFHHMKKEQFSVEIVTEYAKDMVWEERFNVFNDQIYMLGNQNRRLLRLEGKVDYVVTDSPVLLGVCYLTDVPYSKSVERLIVDVFNSYDNYNIFLNRTHKYEQTGRNQTETESDILAVKIKELLMQYDVSYHEIDANEMSTAEIFEKIKRDCIAP